MRLETVGSIFSKLYRLLQKTGIPTMTQHPLLKGASRTTRGAQACHPLIFAKRYTDRRSAWAGSGCLAVRPARYVANELYARGGRYHRGLTIRL